MSFQVTALWMSHDSTVRERPNASRRGTFLGAQRAETKLHRDFCCTTAISNEICSAQSNFELQGTFATSPEDTKA
uniref:Uncharacterized protein n=1 Tax=Ascaris lumbricoides TaxID=6252 RepID=A0A0M3I075_ASCLU